MPGISWKGRRTCLKSEDPTVAPAFKSLPPITIGKNHHKKRDVFRQGVFPIAGVGQMGVTLLCSLRDCLGQLLVDQNLLTSHLNLQLMRSH